MSSSFKSLVNSMLMAKGMPYAIPTDVEIGNPVSEFLSERFAEMYPDNEAAEVVRDIFVNYSNNEPLKTLQVLQRFNAALIEFGEQNEAYISVLTIRDQDIPDLPDGGEGREI